MTKQVQRRRGTASQHTSFTGAEGEISVNTTNKSVHVHDGVTAGGVEAARADLANVSDASLNTALAGNTLSSLTITSADINGGTIDGTVIGGTTPAAVTATSLTATGTTTLAGASTTADITFGDNDKAIFGAGSDLQIYHDGSHSYIDDAGTGDLRIRADNLLLKSASGEDYITATANGSVSIAYDNATKLSTTSTGVDVTGQLQADSGQFDGNVNIDGTVTADGLTVDGNITLNGANMSLRMFESDTTDLNTQIQTNVGKLSLKTVNDAISATKNRLEIDHATGDISFYEDTGTTPKFFWDASAERLGLGTASPSATLHIDNGSSTHVYLRGSSGDPYGLWVDPTGAEFTLGSWGNGARIKLSDSSEYITFGTGVSSTERMRIDSSGNVGIGTSSPTNHNASATTLHVDGGAYASEIRLTNNTTGTASANGLHLSAIGDSAYIWQNETAPLIIGTSGTERMRIDASGSLLVGGTTTNHQDGSTQEQFSYINGSYMAVSRSQGTVAYLNRQSTDGSIVDFRKNGTTVGSIGTKDGDLTIGTGDTGLYFSDGADAIYPYNTSTQSDRDNAVDLGYSTVRFDDIYATNALIQTSDRNEKQDIAELDEAERRVAVAAKGLLRKFRWRDAVAEKGDDARIHFGIIAQDLQAAFAAEGLDAGKYAMFIHTTWTDEETGEERSRMGVRYSELLAFIIAAI